MTDPTLPSGLPPPADLHRALLDWFDAHRRDLPWRRHRSLYGTWISEAMLQQTTVATVVPYWERFLARFPDVATLAAAPEDEVLAAWSGLGYYRRARQLHAAARRVVAGGGRLPADAAGWRDLPGVGPYAAGAIASLGLGLPEPAVDANVRRVLTRWLGATAAPPGPSRLEALARALICVERPGDWNEALMELGATVCAARLPACIACPLQRWCATGRGGPPEALPAPAAARPVALAVRAALLVLWRGDRLWLEPAGGPPVPCREAGAIARDDFSRLHQGLLTLPTTPWYAAAPATLVPDWRPWPPGAGEWAAVGRFRHAITRYRLAIDVLAGPDPGSTPAGGDPGAPPPGRPGGRWVTPAAADELAVSQLTRKALRLFGDGRG